MKKNKDQNGESHRYGTGLAEHASTAAFTTARAITSHVRHRYHTRYHGRYRLAPLVFGFDLILLGLAAVLVGLNIYLFTVLPAPRDSFRLDFVSSELRTLAPVSLEARVTPVGVGPHEDVRMVWRLPPGTRVLEAYPPMSSDGSVYFGSLTAGQATSSRLVVRLLTTQEMANFSFQIEDRESSVAGSISRRVIGSGLVIEPVVPLSSVVRDVPVLYRLKNATNLPLESIRLISGGNRLDGNEELFVERLEPYEERVIRFQPSVSSAVMVQAWVEGVPVILRREAYALLASDPTGVRLALSPSDGRTLSLVAIADRAASVAIWHPGLSDENHVRLLDIPVGRTEVNLPVQSSPESAVWFAFPFAKRPDGYAFGALSSAPISTPFMVQATARYYAVSGDQIGVGALPPRVGETTKLWIGLRLLPTTSDLSGVRVRALLGPGVTVTGRDALPDGGSFSQTDTELIWNLGFLAADPDGVGANFEIQITPDASQLGSVPVLIQSVVAEATDTAAGISRSAVTGALDLNLPEDEFGKNQGQVQ